MTPKQRNYIKYLEHKSGVRFKGECQAEINEFIKNHKSTRWANPRYTKKQYKKAIRENEYMGDGDYLDRMNHYVVHR